MLALRHASLLMALATQSVAAAALVLRLVGVGALLTAGSAEAVTVNSYGRITGWSTR